MSTEGIYTYICTQAYLFFWYADLLIRQKMESRGWSQTENNMTELLVNVSGWTVVLKSECACQRLDWGPRHNLDWVDLPNLYNEEASYGHYSSQCLHTCTVWTSLEKRCSLPLTVYSPKKGTYKYATKLTQTAVWSDLYSLYNSGIFTHCFLFPVYIFKDPVEDPYFLSEKLSFCMCCRQSGVLAVHLLYTSDYYCEFLLLCQA